MKESKHASRRINVFRAPHKSSHITPSYIIVVHATKVSVKTYQKETHHVNLMPRTAVGGTFECLHDGHKRLLHKAFEIAGEDVVDIGLTSDTMAQQRGRSIPDYETRLKELKNYLESLGIKEEAYQIQKLEDPYGTTLTGDYKYIVVSPETYPVSIKINEIRKNNGLNPIEIVKIDFVLADDNMPISSTRIVKGEIDVHGHLKGTRF